MEFREFNNLYEMLKKTVDASPKGKAYTWFPQAGKTESITWQGYLGDIRKAAKSLIALGVKKEDKVNIISYTNYRWILMDMAITGIGACTVGIYQTLLAGDCRYIINHSDAVLIFVENETQLHKVYEIKSEIPLIRKVILLNGSYEGDDWVISFDDFMKLGEVVPDSDLEAMLSAVRQDDIATLVYTSGTTGVPKGAMLTHENAIISPQIVQGSLHLQGDEEQFVFLPLAHIYARLIVYTAVLMNIPVTLSRSMDTIVEDIKIARPHFFCSVPRIFEKVYSKVLSGAEAKGGAALKIFNWARYTGYQVSDCLLDDIPVPLSLRFKYALASKLVFSKLKDALGGRIRFCVSGAAPLEPSIAKFFHAAGILILEGIGMTENMSFSHVNRFDDYRFGWVGLPGPGVEQKIASDGEVLLRGRNVMKGYYKMPEETKEALTEDGWLHTGDVGEIDRRGFLRITGRKKDLIITSGGKNIAPSAIEGLLATSKYISQVCVIGDRRNYLSALITLDEGNIKDYARGRDLKHDNFESLMRNREIYSLIGQEIDEKNRSLASFESIKKFAIVPEFTIENDLLTPTLKVKRNKVVSRYAAIIDTLYKDEINPTQEEKEFIERRKLRDRRRAPLDSWVSKTFERRIMERRTAASL
ncbi:MAG: long-chain fatty acid--CoA ligase [Spirochaetae bacterium HGW-Spirochaetae-1]|jgi:long-chain acyl-CoA synthetase|nr:MAG: long-chain fatty acid--CoA ligase [Spirochaetae bacterium HGW-Spirochaetae-1]